MVQALIFLVTFSIKRKSDQGLKGTASPWDAHEWNMIHVNASKLQGKTGVLRLVDIEGRVVFEKPAEVVSGGYFTTEIYMNELSSGVYVVNLVTEKETLSFKVGKL